MNRRTTWPRRRFLRAGGALAIGLPWLASLATRAQAASDQMPRRIVFLMSSCGVVPDEWFPQQTGRGFTLPYSTAPLAPLQDRLAVVHGVDNASARGQGGNAHTKAGSHTLTGVDHINGQFTKAGGGGFASGISIDQQLAQSLQGGIPSLVTGIDIGVGANGETPRGRFSYTGNNMPVTPIGDPAALFNRLMPFAGMGNGSNEANEAIKKLRLERRSVLDLAMGDIEDLQGRLSAVDRARLDNHLTHLRALEQSIADLPDPEEQGNAACSMLTNPGNQGDIEARTRKVLDLIAFAIRCDITSVATFQWAGAQSALRYGFLPDVPNQSHHGLSHNDGAAYDTPMREIARFHAEQVRYFAEQLASFPEGDGDVLDHTIIVHLNTLNRGNTHNFRDLPVVLLGGTNALKQGHSHRFTNDRTLNDLYITLAQCLGVEMTTFGKPSYVNGQLGALRV